MSISPIAVTTADGSAITSGPVTQQTIPLSIKIPGQDDLSCTQTFLVSKIKYPMILGMPWLTSTNPLVQWRHGTISKPVDVKETTTVSTTSETTDPSKTTEPSETIDPSETTDPSEITDPPARLQTLALLPEKYSKFKTLFQKSAADKLPAHTAYDHTIPLAADSMPPFGPIYSLSEPELKTLREYLKENSDKGFIEPSQSPAGAPILFVKKKDGSLRLCVDYRGLNNITVKNRYALPLISEILDRTRSAKLFTKLDLRGAYNLIRIAPGEEWKTAFRTRYGHYQYKVMPFGLVNAPASFQALINDVLRPYLDIFVIAYLDDILIFSDTQSEHDAHVTLILEALQKADLFVKLEKSEFDRPKIEFLGFNISSSGISMVEDKISNIKSWPTPTNLKQLQSFIGLCNWYRKWIPYFSNHTSAFKDLLKKDNKFLWTSKHQDAFDNLKALFKPGLLLHHFDPQLPAILETDASDMAVSGILSQIKDGEKVPIGFFSQSMSSAEQNYDIADKELLAIVKTLKHWRVYLEGANHTITILCDHANLVPFCTTRPLSRRQARWSITLGGYDFKIQHVSGNSNPRADALSRRPDYQVAQPQPATLLKPHQIQLSSLDDFDSEIPLSGDLEADLKTAYLKDRFTSNTLASLKSGDPIPDKLKHFSISPTGLLLFNNLIYIPRDKSVQHQILRLHHDHPLAGHFGEDKTFNLLSRTFYLPNLRQVTHNYVQGCQLCSKTKHSQHKPYGQLQPLPVPDRPWQSISMDFIVKLPLSENFDSVLVVVDRFSKMAHFIPCKESLSARDLNILLFQHVYKHHGFPESIITDRGTTFMSNYFQDLAKHFQISSKTSTAYHPQTDGQTERVNNILEQYLRAYINYEQDNWSQLLPQAEFAYNNSTSATTQQSPFFINYGFNPRFTLLDSATKTPAADQHASNLSSLWSYLKTQILRAQDSQAHHANKRRHAASQPFGVGDMVMLKRKHFKTNRPNSKLDFTHFGPFKIIRSIRNSAYELQLPPTWKIHPVFHASLLEKSSKSIFHQTEQPPPPEQIDNSLEYQVEAILDSRIRRRKTQYLVKWLGYPDEDNTWEPEENLANAPQLVQDFKARKGRRTLCHTDTQLR